MKLLACLALLLTTATANAQWASDTEAGFVSQKGNTEQENVFFKLKLSRQIFTKYNLALEGGYITSSGDVATPTGGTENVTVAESHYVGGRLTRDFSEKFSVFSGTLYEKNRFAGYEDRISGDNGLKYIFNKSETQHFLSELGHRFRTQYATDENRNFNGRGDKTESQFARLYLEYAKQISETSRFKLWVETFYDFEDSDNLEMNFEPSIDLAIGQYFSAKKPAKVSVKVAYLGMFDNVPAQDDFKRFDSTFTTSLKVLY